METSGEDLLGRAGVNVFAEKQGCACSELGEKARRPGRKRAVARGWGPRGPGRTRALAVRVVGRHEEAVPGPWQADSGSHRAARASAPLWSGFLSAVSALELGEGLEGPRAWVRRPTGVRSLSSAVCAATRLAPTRLARRCHHKVLNPQKPAAEWDLRSEPADFQALGPGIGSGFHGTWPGCEGGHGDEGGRHLSSWKRKGRKMKSPR